MILSNEESKCSLVASNSAIYDNPSDFLSQNIPLTSQPRFLDHENNRVEINSSPTSNSGGSVANNESPLLSTGGDVFNTLLQCNPAAADDENPTGVGGPLGLGLHQSGGHMLMEPASFHLSPQNVQCCGGCGEVIVDKYLMNVLDKAWHASCVRCSDCTVPLTEKCYSRDGRLYCKQDFFR